jgi:G3E family GTPase
MIETTGMADPGPVAQTLFMDDEHIDESDEVKEQIAFANVILLNKVDLVQPEELDRLESRIHSMNSAAKIFRTKDAVIEMDKIFGLGGFDLDRALEVDAKFLEPEYPFEWSGVYDLSPGEYPLVAVGCAARYNLL